MSCLASVTGFIGFTAEIAEDYCDYRLGESEHAPRRIQRYCRRGSHDRARVDALARFRVLAATALAGSSFPVAGPHWLMASEKLMS